MKIDAGHTIRTGRHFDFSRRGLTKIHPKQTELRDKTGCTAVAVERGDDLLVDFAADFKFAENDAVYICGSAEAAQKFYQLFPQE